MKLTIEDARAPVATESAERPVFIVGAARSGTSILYRTLMRHPAFKCSEEDLTESYIFTHATRAFAFSWKYPSSVRRFMLDDRECYTSFLRAIRPMRARSVVGGPWATLRPESLLAFRLARGDHVVRRFAAYAARARGCRRLVEKSAFNVERVEQILFTFPRATILFSARHPVDTFASYRARASRDPSASWAAIRPREFVRLHTRTYEAILRWSSERDAVHILRYEDLTRAPAGAFAEVCGWVGEEMWPGAVEPQSATREWTPDPHLFGAIRARTKCWADFVSEDEARFIESKTRASMVALGYQPYIGEGVSAH